MWSTREIDRLVALGRGRVSFIRPKSPTHGSSGVIQICRPGSSTAVVAGFSYRVAGYQERADEMAAKGVRALLPEPDTGSWTETRGGTDVTGTATGQALMFLRLNEKYPRILHWAATPDADQEKKPA